MPVFFALFVLLNAAIVVCIVTDPPFMRRPLDALAARWRRGSE